MSLNNDIRSFSSYTKGLHTISDISLSEKFAELKLCFPMCYKSKLEKRIEKFKSSALSIDGVYAKITFIKSTTLETEYFEIVAKVAKDIFATTTLANLKCGAQVNIGMLSINPKKWLLDSSPVGKVKLVNSEIPEGHTHTKELTFECSKVIFEHIQKLQYIGLNASGLTIRETHNLDERYYFSIHIGRQTRETTVFGKDLLPGTEFTLTLPFI